MKVLLVEDNESYRLLVREAFNLAGVNASLETVEDGEEAMAYLQKRAGFENKTRPHLILLDLNLPKKDGREVLEEIKSDECLRCIPVIILTSSQAKEDIDYAYNLHTNSYIVKPLEFKQLVEVTGLIKKYWLECSKLPLNGHV